MKTPVHVTTKMLCWFSTSFRLCHTTNCQPQDEDFPYRGKREVEALPKFKQVKDQLKGDVKVPGKQGKETMKKTVLCLEWAPPLQKVSISFCFFNGTSK